MAANGGRVWFVTGGSSGFGRSLALQLLARGERVATTSRDPGRLDPRLRRGGSAFGLALDVADAGRCQAVVTEVLDTFGRIDVLVNNAGHGMIGAVEEVSDAEAKLVFDANFFGLLNVTRAVLPGMRAARSGHIVNISSAAGLVARAGSGLYAATKFALEGITEALHHELKPLGIKVTAIEPGPFRTDFAGRSIHAAATRIGDYDGTAGAWRQAVRESDGQQPGDPDKAARMIIAAVDAAEPPLHLVLGTRALTRVEEKLHALLGEIEQWREASAATDFDR